MKILAKYKTSYDVSDSAQLEPVTRVRPKESKPSENIWRPLAGGDVQSESSFTGAPARPLVGDFKKSGHFSEGSLYFWDERNVADETVFGKELFS